MSIFICQKSVSIKFTFPITEVDLHFYVVGHFFVEKFQMANRLKDKRWNRLEFAVRR